MNRNSANLKPDWRRWWMVVAYAAAMAWVESATVYYLRSMIGRIEPHQSNPLPDVGGFARAELIREFATLVMLFAVGALAGRSWRERIGYSAIAFGLWDILYYVFLRMMCHWPHSLLDWDILFLLPLPWWGPVLSPMLIAFLMMVWGTLASQYEDLSASLERNWRPWLLNFLGMALALYVFMADTIAAARGGLVAIRNVLPQRFHWPLFGVALVLMSAPVWAECRRFRARAPAKSDAVTAPEAI